LFFDARNETTMKPHWPKAVTFDFFNTLVYPRAGGSRGLRLVDYLRGEGLNPDEWRHEILYEIFDIALPRTVAGHSAYRMAIVERALHGLGVQAAASDVRRHAAAVWRILGPDAFAVYADVPPTLGALRSAGVPLAVVSNWPRGLQHFCDELELAAYFDVVVASGEAGAAKPDAAIFAEAAARLHVAPADILHVGDSPVDDIAGATGAGFAAVLVDRARVAAGIDDTAGIRRLDALPAWMRARTRRV